MEVEGWRLKGKYDVMTTQESIITNILVELDHFKVSEREVSNKGAQDSKVSRPKMLSPLPATKFLVF